MERPPEAQQALEDCIDVYGITEETVAYCLQRGPLATGRLVATLLTTSDVCRATSEFIALDAGLAFRSAEFCAEVCDYCADACEQGGPDDEQLRACAEAARGCADSCRELAAVAVE